jgi:hypothetical protein
MKKILLVILAIVIVIVAWYCLSKNNLFVIKKSVHTNRQTYSNTSSGIEFQYPKNFSGNVWAPIVRPPILTIVSNPQNPIENGCPDLKDTNYSLEKTIGQTNNGLKYFLYRWEDVGAWSLYSLYCYVIQGKTDYYVFDFAIRSHSGCWKGQCGAYCETQFEQECKDLNRLKDIENPIREIVSTFKITK